MNRSAYFHKARRYKMDAISMNDILSPPNSLTVIFVDEIKPVILGEFMTAVRVEANMPLKRTARRLGRVRKHLEKTEAGKAKPDTTTIISLFKEYGYRLMIHAVDNPGPQVASGWWDPQQPRKMPHRADCCFMLTQDSDMPKKIGNFFAHMREAEGFTKTSFADALQMNRGNYGAIENGRLLSIPRLPTWLRIFQTCRRVMAVEAQRI